MVRFPRSLLFPLLLALLLVACGGDNGGNGHVTSPPVALEPNAPVATGDTATDGLNWFNFRRQQAGVLAVVRDPRADIAARGHSEYQRLNDTITHEQTPGAPGFTGITVGDRLAAASYNFTSGYAYGEVISATSDPNGFNAAEDLIAAIYHRFVILEPVFKQAGSGASTVPRGLTYFTTNFVTQQLSGLGAGKMVTYPFSGQARVPRIFFSDNEVPDPVPGRNEVGYPVSVHADIISTLAVQNFVIRPRGGSPLVVQLLTHGIDPQTPPSAAAIIPINPLAPASIYDVEFLGAVDGVAIARAWSFTTQ
jgi:uncharacterized protein YkwD